MADIHESITGNPMEAEPEVTNDENVMDLLNDTELEVAVKAEVELLRPQWAKSLREEQPMITEMHLDALLSVKLNEAKVSIPKRWKAEKKWKVESDQTKQLVARLKKILEALQKKDRTDLSAEIQGRQLRQVISVWQEQKKKPLELAFQALAISWSKPFEDPLSDALSSLVEELDELVATAEFEISSRGLFKEATQKDSSSDNQTVTVKHEPSNVMHFDAARHVTKFGGAEDDEDVLFKFAEFKTSWDNVAAEMSTMRGCTPIVMFQKLKNCLEEPALGLVSKYSAGSANSYEAAMKDLVDKYEDPIGLASTYLKRAINGNQEPQKMADSMLQAYNALNNMKDQFEKDSVDMYDFALIQAFTSAMTPNMLGDWTGYKVQKKQSFFSSNTDGPKEWKRGMVENHKDFTTWLTYFIAKQPSNAGRVEEPVHPVSTASNFAVAKVQSGVRCFLCKELNPDNHPTARCPRGQNMDLRAFKAACRVARKCYRCAKDFETGHSCQAVCTVCHGKEDEALGPHHALMCPSNRFRKFDAMPLRKKVAAPFARGTKRPAEADGDEKLSKIVKAVGKEVGEGVAKALRESNKENKPGKANKGNNKKKNAEN